VQRCLVPDTVRSAESLDRHAVQFDYFANVEVFRHLARRRISSACSLKNLSAAWRNGIPGRGGFF
jgi:hypothetical protein